MSPIRPDQKNKPVPSGTVAENDRNLPADGRKRVKETRSDPGPGHPTRFDTPRRLQMRVILKLMGIGAMGVALLTILMAFFSPPSTHIRLDREIDLAGLQAGEVRLVEWGAREIMIQRRDADTLESLARAATVASGNLRDPDSRYSRQPKSARNAWRSVEREYFVAYNASTDLGCKLEFVAPAVARAETRPWSGGFRDTCRGGRYDPAGRVINGEPGLRNLEIPDHALHLTPVPRLVLHGDRR